MRFHRNGNDLDRNEQMRSRYIGQERNGWQVIDIIKDEHKNKLVVKCTTCGETRTVYPSRLDNLSEHRKCVKLLALTKKQKHFLEVFNEHENSITLTAQALNVTKASASDMYRCMRRNYERMRK